MAKLKKQYRSAYVDRHRPVDRRGRPPARYSVPRLRPEMTETLPTRSAATGQEVLKALEDAAGVNGRLDEDATVSLYTRRKLTSLHKARPIADALEVYCRMNSRRGGPVLEVYDAALPPFEARGAVIRLGKDSLEEAHTEIAINAGLHTEVVRTLCAGHVAPSRLVSHLAAAISSLGVGSLVPVGWDNITWHRHVPPERSARDTIETWLASH